MIGIDEVGRGAWAGPLVVVAAKKKLRRSIVAGLTDSKRLSQTQRVVMLPLLEESFAYGIGIVEHGEIDQLGLSKAMTLACERALNELNAKEDEHIILDGTVNFLRDTIYSRVSVRAKADLLIPVVSAASVIAKQYRDALMRTYAKLYPAYGFERHVGYGTMAHKIALDCHGPSPIHRYSFAPINRMQQRNSRKTRSSSIQ